MGSETTLNSIRRFLDSLFGIKERNTRSRHQEKLGSFTKTEIIYEIARRRKVPCKFLFIGESRNGKTTAISRIFSVNTKEISSKTKRVFRLMELPKIESNKDHSKSVIECSILEAPGLLRHNSAEDDAKVIVALANLLKKEFQSRIPTLVFVVARMDDNRFEGDQSNFSRMLRAFTQIRSYITDTTCSNMILLLTHSDKPEVQQDFNFRIERYQVAFKHIFKSQPVACMPVNRKTEFHHLMVELSRIACKRGQRERGMLHAFVHDVTIRKRLEIGCQLSSFPIENYLPSRRALVNRAMSRMLSNEVIETSGRIIDSDSDDDTRKLKFEQVSFYPFRWLKLPKQRSKLRHFTCVYPQTKIVLANKTCVDAADCLIGDQVLGFNHGLGVITDITKIHIGNDPWLEYKIAGITYCVARSTQGSAKSAETFVYVYQNDAFRVVNKKHLTVDYQPSRVLYYLEVDGGEGTFVADGLLLACNVM